MRYLAKANESIANILRRELTNISARKLDRLFQSKRVLIDQKICVDPSQLVQVDQEITIRSKMIHLPNGVKLLHDEPQFTVVEKPTGLLSVATTNRLDISLHKILKNHFKKLIYPVHRLDKETSGVIVFAKTAAARDYFKDVFHDHEIRREYLAILEGKIENSGFWENYLFEDKQFVMRCTGDPQKGKLAKTTYEPFKVSDRYTSVRITLKTGRKNQIRAQASFFGHPVVGDRKYGSQHNPIKRLGLHAVSLGFAHPITKKMLSFFSPPSIEFNSMLRYHQNKRRGS